MKANHEAPSEGCFSPQLSILCEKQSSFKELWGGTEINT